MDAPPWLTAQPYAHRGLHHRDRYPENTMAAFLAAADKGLGIELDVQLSRDGVVMVIHDHRLERLTGHAGRVRDFTAAELGAMTVISPPHRIETLSAVLEAVADRVPILIEVKAKRPRVGRLEAAVAEVVRRYDGRAAVMSWNPFSVLWFYRFAPDIPRGLVVTSFLKGRYFSHRLGVLLATLLPTAAIADAWFLAHDIRELPTPLSRRYRRHGRPVLTWTVRTEADRERAARFADAIIFEEI